jgi:acetylxylan esterase
MKVTAAAALFAGLAAAGPVDLAERQSCPKVYIFGARETTLPQSNGYGTAAGLVNSVKSAYSGAGSEAIVYPACGGQSNCGGISYDNSASQGTAAVVKAVTAYNQKCPSTQIVLIGYSQVSNASNTENKVLTRIRVVKSWTTPSAVVQVLP